MFILFIKGKYNYITRLKGATNMNDILKMKYLKALKKHGVKGKNAEYIVDEVMKVGYKNHEFALKYAVDLVYGLGLSKKIS